MMAVRPHDDLLGTGGIGKPPAVDIKHKEFAPVWVHFMLSDGIDRFDAEDGQHFLDGSAVPLQARVLYK